MISSWVISPEEAASAVSEVSAAEAVVVSADVAADVSEAGFSELLHDAACAIAAIIATAIRIDFLLAFMVVLPFFLYVLYITGFSVIF